MNQTPTTNPWVFGRLLAYLKPYWPVAALALLALGFSAWADLSIPGILQKAIDGPILTTHSLEELWTYGLQILLLLVGGLLGAFGMTYGLAWVTQQIMKDLRMTLHQHFLQQSATWLNQNPVGKMVSGVTSDVSAVTEFFNTLFTSLLKDLLTMAGVLVALLLLNPTLGFWTLLALPPAAGLIFAFRFLSRRAFRRTRHSIGQLSTFLSEHLQGLSVIQMFSKEKASFQEFQNKNQELLQANLGEMWVNAVFRPMVEVLNALTLALILWFALGLHTQGLVSLGILVAFITLSAKFFAPMASIAENFSTLQGAMAGGERIFNFLDDTSLKEPQGSGTPRDPRLQKIQFKDVSFSYTPGELVLKNFYLTLTKGDITAIVGYTGAGKSTVTHLLTGLWAPQQGQILINNEDLKDLSLAWVRKTILSVLQDVVLFKGTIHENIDLGRCLPRSQIETICRQVQAHGFISKLPQGYDTDLQEGAHNLSAGQRQLLSFARVLAQDPQVVVMDEATAHVDSETEHLLQKALDEVLKNRTALIIAHRLSTIRHAHRIIVMDQGTIVEEGNHQTLMDRRGFYYNLYKLQYEKSTSSDQSI